MPINKMRPETEKLKELFPNSEFNATEDRIMWRGGSYVDGTKTELTLDDSFTAEELMALAEWMASPK